MKIKRKISERTLKYFICTILLLSLVWNTAFITISAISQNKTQERSSYSTTNTHMYHGDVRDGGLYYLQSAGNGDFLTVNNASSSMFTTLSTNSWMNALHQEFRLEYMGNDTYRIVAHHTEGSTDPNAIDGRMYIAPEWYDSGEIVSLYPISEFWGGYRLQRVYQNGYVLLTEASNFTCALTIDTANQNRIIHKTYNSMSDTEKLYALWYLEGVSPQAESYSKYYIRALNTKIYLENPFATSAMVQAAPFNGTESQQWKKTQTPNANQYYLSPLNNLHRYLSNYENDVATLQIARYDDPQYQYLWLEYMLDELDGSKSYRIGTTIDNVTKYLGLGDLIAGSSNTYELTWSTDTYTYWAFEEVLFDDPSMRAVQLYTPQTGTISDYYGYDFYTLKNGNRPTRYQIVLHSSEKINLYVCKDRDMTGPVYLNLVSQTTHNGEKISVYDTMLEAHTCYYFYLQSTSENSTWYNLLINQFSISVHLGSLYVGDESHFQDVISTGFNSSWYHIQNMNWNLDTKELISAANASIAIHSATGASDFQSDVFVYNGHGGPGYACYEGSDMSSYLSAPQIPSMIGCELAIWASCQSAALSNGTSMAHASFAKGAKTVLGWSKSINAGDTQVFFNTFWDQISRGKSIDQAIATALALPKCTCVSAENYELILSDPDTYWYLNCSCNSGSDTCPCNEGSCPCSTPNHYTYYYYAYGIVDSLVRLGDGTNVLYSPSGNGPLVTNIQNTLNGNLSAQNSFDKSTYTLMAENPNLGIKLYSKLLNGIPTDDCYIEYYENDVLARTYKSQFTLEDAAVNECAAQAYTILQSNPEVNINNLAYTYRDGAWHLIERREVVTTHDDFSYTEVIYVNLSEGGAVY